MINKNKLFRQAHIYISLFFLPLAAMYALTGLVYIFGFDQDVGAKRQVYQVQARLESGKEVEFLLSYLKENNLKIPSDSTPKKARDGGISIGGTHYSANIKQLDSSLVQISTTTRSILGDMIMLHKDKAKWYFAIMSVGFGVALILLYISGLFITLLNVKKDRGKQIATIIAGLIVSIILGVLSVS